MPELPVEAEEPKTVDEPVIVAEQSQPAPTQPQGDLEAEAKQFIYFKESGNRTNAINPSSGACGIGQALPCSKLPCSLDDYVCQDNWFTDYMTQRYSTWAKAKEFWLCTGYCTNNYGTTYKTATWW